MKRGILGVLGSAALLLMCGCPTDYFTIHGEDGSSVLSVDVDGDIQSVHPIVESANVAQLIPDEAVGEFLVLDGDDVVIARVDGQAKVLYLKGALIHDENLALDDASPEFGVLDAGKTAQAVIDTGGNLRYRGNIKMHMTHAVSDEAYSACTPLDISVTLYCQDKEPIKQLTVTQTLPTGFVYDEVVNASVPAVDMPLVPGTQNGTAMTFTCAAPTSSGFSVPFTYSFTYRVFVTERAVGEVSVYGTASYTCIDDQSHMTSNRSAYLHPAEAQTDTVLDLAGDLKRYLLEHKTPPVNPYTWYGSEWYAGQDGNNYPCPVSEACEPNGCAPANPDTACKVYLPDIVEFAALQRALAAPDKYLDTKKAWCDYNEQLALHLPEADDTARHVLAAYLTLGYLGAHEAARREMLEIFESEATWLTSITPPDPNPFHPKLDPDGDNFGNNREWEYLQLFITDPEELGATYAEWALDGLKKPAVTDFSSIAKVPVTIEIVGEGYVYPEPGVHEFASYSLDCANPTIHPKPIDCAYNEIEIRAESLDGWVFRRWMGADSFEVNGNRLSISCDAARTIMPEFVYRPGIDILDLVADLGAYLYSIGEISAPENVYDLSYDQGEIIYNGDGSETFSGNGIPDAAEFLLLENVLQDVTLDLSKTGGVANQFVYEDWAHNLAQAQSDLSTQSAAIQRTVAAYMTLGYFEVQEMIKASIFEHFGVTLITADYANQSGQEFRPDADCDNDGWSNLDEWNKTLLENAAGTEGENNPSLPNMSAVNDYVDAAKNRDAPGQDVEPPASEPCISCPNDACNTPRTKILLKNTLFDLDGAGPNPATEVITISGTSNDCYAPVLSADHIAEVTPGKTVKIKIDSAPNAKVPFYYWNAFGLLINGSDEPDPSFVVPLVAEDTIIRILAVCVDKTSQTVSLDSYRVPEHIAIKVIQNGDVIMGNQKYENGLYKGVEFALARNTPLSVSYITNDQEYREDGYNDKSHGLITYGVKAHLDVFSSLEDVMSIRVRRPNDITGYKVTHKASANIGDACIDHGGCFLYSATTGKNNDNQYPGISSDVKNLPISCNWVSSADPYVDASGGKVFQHTVRKKSTLKLEGTSCQGYATADPARKYYLAPTEQAGEEPNPEVVQITGHALPGFRFSHWRGDGICWTNGNKVSEQWRVSGSSQRLDNKDNLVTDSTIYIKMCNEENKAAERTIDAVFVLDDCPCGDQGGCPSLSDYDVALLQAFFPNMRMCNVSKLGPDDRRYNCVGYVLDIMACPWDEIDREGDQNGDIDLGEMKKYLNEHGACDYIIYGLTGIDVHHVAKFDGVCAESKCSDKYPLYRHDAIEMENGSYGWILD